MLAFVYPFSKKLIKVNVSRLSFYYPQVLSTGPMAGQLAGSEDCLNLNIYRPAAESGPLPVMVQS